MSAIVCAVLASVMAWADPAANPMDAVREKERQQAVARIAPAKARLLKVTVAETERTAATLHPEPLLRWSNATAGSIYGEVFLWSGKDRPAAIASIYRWYHPFKDSTVEIVSLSEAPLEVQEAGSSTADSVAWKCPPHGVTFKNISASAPGASRGLRLSQMRTLAREFSAELADDRGGESVTRELRLLNQPIHRYGNDQSRIVDGTLFAFVESTDPEVVLIMEAVREKGSMQWRYGLARMNAHGMQIRHGKELVQTWVRVHDPARDPQSSYAFFNFDPESVKIDSSNGP